MRIGRTVPPAAAPLSIYNLLDGFRGQLIGQPEIERFRKELKEYFQVKHCFLLSSGKAALTVILCALQSLSPNRDEVLIPAFTCFSVPSAIVRAGLKVRLADINPATLDYDFEFVHKTMNSKKRFLAVVTQDLFGLPANFEKLRGILGDSEITIIEDAAQAMGGKVKNSHLGTLGDVGFFSLGRGKAYSTVEGGVVITNSEKLAKALQFAIESSVQQSNRSRMKLIAYAFALMTLMQPPLFWFPKSLPGLKLGETIFDPQFSLKKYSSFQAGLSRNWKKKLESFQDVRKKNVLCWMKVLNRFQWLKPIESLNNIRKNVIPLLRFPVLVQNKMLRDSILMASEERGLGIMPSYPGPINTINELGFKPDAQIFLGAAESANQLLTFPVHGFITSKDRQRVIAALKLVQKKVYLPTS